MKIATPLTLSLLFIFLIAGFNIKSPEKETATFDCCEQNWRGTVAIEDIHSDKNYYFLAEKIFVQNGSAQVQQAFSRYYRFWTNIELDIPCAKNISADNVKLEWYSKSNLSLGIDESDMGATLIGDKDTASINCITYYRPPYCTFRFGRKKINDAKEVVNNPTDWAKYSLEISNKTMKFYKNDVLKKQLKDNQTLGTLKKLTIHFKGAGRIDWVKLYEKNALVFKEDFEIAGKSSIRWTR